MRFTNAQCKRHTYLIYRVSHVNKVLALFVVMPTTSNFEKLSSFPIAQRTQVVAAVTTAIPLHAMRLTLLDSPIFHL